PSVIVVCETEFDRHIAALDKACFVQAFAERRHDTCTQLRHTGIHKSNHRHRGLLRARRERPCRRAAEQRDESPPFHSITSSARASSVSGTVRPNALAVLRLMINSNLIGCWTGKSAGLTPFNTRST